ncbi:MAG: type pilus assembly protein PilE [Pseudomonadota bacterium]|nr:type pilus assembly protein PilE [Pseudomonadota bacterium]
MLHKYKGFTLIELMIVVAIIGILAAIGYPSYQRQMLESRREDAHVALLRMADAQEKFYLQNNTYAAPGQEANVGGTGTENGWYALAITVGNASTYTLTATPSAGSPQLNDTGCDGTAAGSLITLTSAGQKTPATCW